MAFVIDNSKMNAVKAFINTWLKDKTVYCAACGQDFNGTGCCEAPHLTDRATRISEFIQANKEEQALQLNDYGASKDRNMRRAISMPAELFRDIETYFKSQYGEKFLDNKNEVRDFMKMFPQVSIARRV